MHLRRDPDHIKHGKHDLAEEIMVLGLCHHHKGHGYVLLLLVQLIVQVVIRLAPGILEESSLGLVSGDPVCLCLLEKNVIILLVLLHQVLRVIVLIFLGIGDLNIRQVILLDVLRHSIQPLSCLRRVDDRVQHLTPLKFRRRGPRLVERLRLLEAGWSRWGHLSGGRTISD
jgi:hypothetical protein